MNEENYRKGLLNKDREWKLTAANLGRWNEAEPKKNKKSHNLED